jgi:hypothetical protein
MSMRSDLSSAEDAANEALLVISTLRMTLEAMQADERVALIRRLEEYGDRIGISALMNWSANFHPPLATSSSMQLQPMTMKMKRPPRRNPRRPNNQDQKSLVKEETTK